MSTQYIVGLSTTSSEEEAAKIARSLIEEKLAAGVSILPGLRSIYTWKKKICDEKEVLIIIKTTSNNQDRLKRRLKELHSYEVPELIFLPITDGLPKYLEWLESPNRN